MYRLSNGVFSLKNDGPGDSFTGKEPHENTRTKETRRQAGGFYHQCGERGAGQAGGVRDRREEQRAFLALFRLERRRLPGLEFHAGENQGESASVFNDPKVASAFGAKPV